MAVWAIGDIQGCFDPLERLLKLIDFNPKKDTLWLAGDLVNRGNKSLEVLEFLYSIRDSTKIVLGNHDISLIGAYYGLKKKNPSIEPILNSPRVDELIGWLRSQRLFVWDFKLGYAMAHAGVSPRFDFNMARDYASRVEEKLKSANVAEWLGEILKRGVDVLDFDESDELELDRYILSSFTRMRYCYSDGRLEFSQKGKPSPLKLKERGLYAWFECPVRKKIGLRILFGHWSTLGYFYNGEVVCLDSGCVWQRELTAIRLDIKEVTPVVVECS